MRKHNFQIVTASEANSSCRHKNSKKEICNGNANIFFNLLKPSGYFTYHKV